MVLLIPLFLVWANTHGQFVLGLGVFGIWYALKLRNLHYSQNAHNFLLKICYARFSQAAQCSVHNKVLQFKSQDLMPFGVGIVAVVATLVNPFGWRLYEEIFRHFGNSLQKYEYLPEASTDSIFAVVAEETGFLGAAIVIILFLALIMTGIKIAKEAPDKFSQVLAVGIVSWIAFQVILNIGSITALTPLTGVPLPFFSYGGSALTMLLVSCGILLNISRH